MSYPPTMRLRAKALELRQTVLEMCCRAGTGHVTSAFSSVEILVALYYGGILRHNPADPAWPDRDRFILSKGQASVLLYPVLADRGYFPASELERFAAADGRFGVHLQHDVPGAEITSGSLGMGFGLATGLALAARRSGREYLTFTLLGDAECYEGSVWEAAFFAAHNRLNNLVAIVDRNHLGATHFTEHMVSLEPLADKWKSFGWQAFEVDGHDFEALLPLLDKARRRPYPQPICLIADTVKGRGVSFMSNALLWHGIAPDGDRAESARDELAKIREEMERGNGV